MKKKYHFTCTDCVDQYSGLEWVTLEYWEIDKLGSRINKYVGYMQIC